jgi:hypothetical protein
LQNQERKQHCLVVKPAFSGYYSLPTPARGVRNQSQGVIMSVIGGAVRGVSQAVNRAASATTAAAGAVGGAAVNGVIGGVTGAAEGVKRGMNSGSHSTPAAALAFGALGVAGLVEWPVLLAVGGGALLLQRLNRKERQPEPRAVKANLKSVPAESAPARKAPAKTAAKSTAKKAPGRRAGAGDLRSTN